MFLAVPAGQISCSKEDEPAAVVQEKEKEKIIWEAVEKLPRLWGVVVVLFYREEKSVKDIAKIIKKRQNTVKIYLFRARKELKRIIGQVLGEDIDVGS